MILREKAAIIIDSIRDTAFAMCGLAILPAQQLRVVGHSEIDNRSQAARGWRQDGGGDGS
jgi:hypothetical protein